MQICKVKIEKKAKKHPISAIIDIKICRVAIIVVPLHPLFVRRARLQYVAEYESVAQQVEHIPFKDGVLGSSPSWFTEQRAIAALFCIPATLIYPNGRLNISRGPLI